MVRTPTRLSDWIRLKDSKKMFRKCSELMNFFRSFGENQVRNVQILLNGRASQLLSMNLRVLSYEVIQLAWLPTIRIAGRSRRWMNLFDKVSLFDV